MLFAPDTTTHDLLKAFPDGHTIGENKFFNASDPVVLAQFDNEFIQYLTVSLQQNAANSHIRYRDELIKRFGGPSYVEVPKYWEGKLYRVKGLLFEVSDFDASCAILLESTSAGTNISFIVKDRVSMSALVPDFETLEVKFKDAFPDGEQSDLFQDHFHLDDGFQSQPTRGAGTVADAIKKKTTVKTHHVAKGKEGDNPHLEKSYASNTKLGIFFGGCVVVLILIIGAILLRSRQQQ